MKPCTDCQAARETNGLWAFHCPTCLWCGARLVKRIRRYPKSTDEEIGARRKQVIADWAAAGHDETALRALIAEPGMPVQPGGKKQDGPRLS